MAITKSREASRLKRKFRIKSKIRGTDERPRLCVFRSHKYTYVQIVSDDSGKILVAGTTKNLEKAEKSSKSKESAKALGLKIAEIAKTQKIERVVFDRNGYVYHGRIAAVAEGAREGGLQF